MYNILSENCHGGEQEVLEFMIPPLLQMFQSMVYEELKVSKTHGGYITPSVCLMRLLI
jgi:hypothetical protein